MQFSIALSASGLLRHQSLIQGFNNYSMAGVVVRDTNLGRVSLTGSGRTSVAYEPGMGELKDIAKGAEVLGNMWFTLGAKGVNITHREISIVENQADIPLLMEKIISDPKNLLIEYAHPDEVIGYGRDLPIRL